MKNTPLVAPGKARPVALVALALVVAVTLFALMVGCGGKAQESTSSSSETPPSSQTSEPAGTPVPPMDEGALGAKVYTDRCVLCHGAEGKGDGVAAAGLNPKPRNHTDGAYMKTRTDDDLRAVIRDGKGGMPAWGSVLSEAEIAAVLKHVRSLAR